MKHSVIKPARQDRGFCSGCFCLQWPATPRCAFGTWGSAFKGEEEEERCLTGCWSLVAAERLACDGVGR